MADATAIEWTDSTFNPWTGCTKVSPGCDECYAESWSKRAGQKVGKWGPGAPRVRTTPANWRDPLKWNQRGFVQCPACGWRGERSECILLATSCPRCPEAPAVQPARRRVFCASLADVFDNEVPNEWRADLWDLIRKTRNLDWLLLTKRIGNALTMLPSDFNRHTFPHVAIGATMVNQSEFDRDVGKLLAINAALLFASFEPLLGPIDTTAKCPPHHAAHLRPDRLGWVIVGGESGHNARPMHPDWARSLRDQCAAAGVPFLFKQWGEFLPAGANEADPTLADVPESRIFWTDGQKWDRFDGQRANVDLAARVGKKAAGRLLDGVEHNGFPEVQHA